MSLLTSAQTAPLIAAPPPPRIERRHRRHPLHIVRGPALAQRLLPLLLLQDLHGRQGLHHRQRGHPLPGVRQEAPHGRRRRAVDIFGREGGTEEGGKLGLGPFVQSLQLGIGI